MPIRQLLTGSEFKPEQIAVLMRAYDLALKALHLVDRDDPVCELVARKIIQTGKGLTDPKEIAKIAVKQLGLP
jgi:hypothetical protein